MATTGISGITASGGLSTATTRRANDLTSEDFFKLLITELQHQDPLKPSDSNQLVQEVSNIRQMDLSANLDKTLTSLAQQQRIGGATGMIGRYVTGYATSSGGQSVGLQGVVIGVQFSATGEALLQLHTGDVLPLKNVTSVTLIDPQTGQPIGTGTGTGNSGNNGGDGSDTSTSGPPGSLDNHNP